MKRNRKTLKTAAQQLLTRWTGWPLEDLDPARADDIRALLLAYRRGRVLTTDSEDTNFDDYAHTPRDWPSGNHGTPRRLLAQYGLATDPHRVLLDLEAATA